MRAIICAQGGTDSRWEVAGRPYLGVPKHLISIDGETLIARTVRLLREHDVDDIVITAPPGDPRYELPGARTVTLEDPAPHGSRGMNLITATRPLWSPDTPTALMFGDVYYTDAAIAAITGETHPEPWWFRRPTKSRVTGHPWDEPFAFVFGAGHHERIAGVALRLVEGWRGPRRLHLWHLHAALLGRPARRVEDLVDSPTQTVIDDWTDDIDTPADFRRFVGRRFAGAAGVVALVPWRHTSEPWRRRSREFTRARLDAAGITVVEGHHHADEGPFNRSLALHRAAVLAGDWEVAVVLDADTFVDPDQFWAAAHCARNAGQLVLAFDHLKLLSESASNVVMRGADPARFPDTATTLGHVSSCVAVPRSLWDQVGGFDTRFSGWGAEDRAFHAACHAFAGRHDRIIGPAWHLWHPFAPERNGTNPHYLANRTLGRRYKVAAGLHAPIGYLGSTGAGVDTTADLDAMRALLTEPGGPLDPRRPAITQPPPMTEPPIDGAIQGDPMRVISERHPNLRAFGVRFTNGSAEVDDPATLDRLKAVARRFGLSFEPIAANVEEGTETYVVGDAGPEFVTLPTSDVVAEPEQHTDDDSAESDGSESGHPEPGTEDAGSELDSDEPQLAELTELVENGNVDELVDYVGERLDLLDVAVELEQGARARKSALERLAKLSPS